MITNITFINSSFKTFARKTASDDMAYCCCCFLVTLVDLLLFEPYYFDAINLGNPAPFCSYHDLIH